MELFMRSSLFSASSRPTCKRGGWNQPATSLRFTDIHLALFSARGHLGQRVFEWQVDLLLESFEREVLADLQQRQSKLVCCTGSLLPHPAR
eukprot:2317821-Amphidinium_carterae.1